jgi:hypothetical protein
MSARRVKMTGRDLVALMAVAFRKVGAHIVDESLGDLRRQFERPRSVIVHASVKLRNGVDCGTATYGSEVM